MPVEFPAPPGDIVPPGQFSHLAIASGELIALSGQTGRDPSGAFAEGIDAQTEQVYGTIGALLQAAQVDWSAVVSFRTYVVGEVDLQAFRAARERVYARLYPDGTYPTNTLLVVAGLGRDEALVEIETLAVR